jgi:hypothetical protein
MNAGSSALVRARLLRGRVAAARVGAVASLARDGAEEAREYRVFVLVVKPAVAVLLSCDCIVARICKRLSDGSDHESPRDRSNEY